MLNIPSSWAFGSLGAFLLLLSLFVMCYFLLIAIKKSSHFHRNMYGQLPQKLWMTFGLAIFFLSFYLFVIFVGPAYMNREIFFQGLQLGLEHPGDFFYWGIFLFVLNTLLILLVRLVLKYIFNKFAD